MAKAPKQASKPAKKPAETVVDVAADLVAKAIEVVRVHASHVKTIYINAKGEYHFHARPGFTPVSVDGSEMDAGEATDIEPAKPIDPPAPPSLPAGVEF